MWETEYKETFVSGILLAIVKKCEHCVPDKVFLEVIEENFSITISKVKIKVHIFTLYYVVIQ